MHPRDYSRRFAKDFHGFLGEGEVFLGDIQSQPAILLLAMSSNPRELTELGRMREDSGMEEIEASKGTGFLGLRTAIYSAPDLDGAKAWYSSVLGLPPYFDQPFYVGFNVGGFELGLDPNAVGTSGEAGGVVAYWGVEDARAALARLLSLGATPHKDVQDVGEGIKVATVVDPFGNLLGVIENPQFTRTNG
jgi:predicted enzyme related to lactoylglutathione lyase